MIYAFVAFFLCSSNTQVIVEADSQISFEIVVLKCKKIKGYFSSMTGEIAFNEADLEHSNIIVHIEAKNIKASNKRIEEYLQKKDFFEVEKHPKISFESQFIKKEGINYIATGQLSIHGITKTINLPFTHENNRFSGQIAINRFDYEIGNHLGTFLVEDEVILSIDCIVE